MSSQGPYKGKREARVWKLEKGERGWKQGQRGSYAAGFHGGGMGQELRNAGYLWKLEKAKGQSFH